MEIKKENKTTTRKALERGLALASLLLIKQAATLAFSHNSRKEIKERAMYRSELDGSHHRPMECSHLDHRRDSNYDSPENGLYVTDIQHFAYHYMFRDTPGKIGLNKHANEYALDALAKRIKETNKQAGEFVDMHAEVDRALDLWESYLAGDYVEA